MKKRLTIETITSSLIKSHIIDKGWVLCVGAGISLPIFPSWNELVRTLIIEQNGSISDDAIKEIQSSFGADALMQAASNLGNRDLFTDVLSNNLYSNVKKQTTTAEWESFCIIMTSNNASSHKESIWRTFISIRERLFKNTTAYDIAKLIAKSHESNYAPTSIISFNVESLLYALINSFKRETIFGKINQGKVESINMMTQSISSYTNGRIPYYFCHGILLKGLTKETNFLHDADSKLIFSESQYLQMANTNFSWQSLIFLNACVTSVMVFVGVSLSDTNMRKWLTWVQYERSRDIDRNVDSTQHYWINKKSINLETMDWMEASVHHLGVRIIWINEWSEIAGVIKKITGV